LSTNVESVIESEPELKIPPPDLVAELPENVECLTVRLAELYTPPPESACPLAMVSESSTTSLAVTRNTRLFSSPSTMSEFSADASIVSGLSSHNAAPFNVIVAPSNAASNVTVVPKPPVAA